MDTPVLIRLAKTNICLVDADTGGHQKVMGEIDRLQKKAIDRQTESLKLTDREIETL